MKNNLDTKSFADSRNDFERLFISIREVLERNDSHCMDVEYERLLVCQEISKIVHKNRKNIFKDVRL